MAIFEVSVCWNFNLSLNKRKEKKVFLIFDFDKNTVQNFFLNVKIITIWCYDWVCPNLYVYIEYLTDFWNT